jgi:hypothetical protein
LQASIFRRSQKLVLQKEIRSAAGNGETELVAELLKIAKVKYLNEGDEVCSIVPVSGLLYVDPLSHFHRWHQNNDTAIITASSNGHTEVVKLLVGAGASIDAMNKVGTRFEVHFVEMATIF